jgi:hypothetical protein
MTVMKLAYQLKGQASEALAPHVDRVFNNPGSTFLAVVEFRHSERVEYADEDAEPSVKCRVASMEVANTGEQEQHVRSLLRALHLQRTAQGTLDAAGEVKLSKQTIAQAAGLAGAEEVARLRVALGWVHEQLQALGSASGLREADLRKAVTGLDAKVTGILAGAPQTLDGAW